MRQSVLLGLLLCGASASAWCQGLTVTPNSGTTNSVVTVTSTGFTPPFNTGFYFDERFMGGCPLDSDAVRANCTIQFNVPGATVGEYVVRASNSIGETATANFTITDTASLSVSPSNGPAGTLMTLTVANFAEPFNTGFYFDGQLIGACPPESRSNCTIQIRAPGTPIGAHTISASNSVAQSDERPFEITPAPFSIHPTCGPAGTVVTASGRQFAPDSNIGVYFNDGFTGSGMQVGPSGSFELTFVVPGIADGVYSVRASSGVNSQEARFVVGPCGFAGQVTEVAGTVRAVAPDGSSRPLAVGDVITQGESIETGPDSAVTILFEDNTSFVMDENSRMSADQLIDFIGDEDDSGLWSWVQGVFIYTSGLIGKHDDEDNPRIDTPVGCICIRGTELIGDFDPVSQTLTVHLIHGSIALRPRATGVVTTYNAPITIVQSGGSLATAPLTQAAYDAMKSAILERFDPPDTTPPVVSPSVTGTLGNDGWYRSTVGVTWTVVDEQSPISNQTGCSASAVTSDTAGITFTCSASSGGGTTSQSVTIKRDANGPSVTIAAPLNGGSYALGSAVAANYTCADPVAGLIACTGTVANGAAIDTATAGAKTFSVTARDQAGNVSTSSIGYTVAPAAGDTTPPVITVRLDGTLGNNGWYRSDVTVTWTVSDPHSPISSQSGCTQSRVKSDTWGTTFTCRAVSAGGTRTQSLTVKRDATAPTILTLIPLGGTTVPKGIKIPAVYACVDLGSGPATCTLNVGALIDTAAKGTKTFVVTSTDAAGNTSTQNTSYKVQ